MSKEQLFGCYVDLNEGEQPDGCVIEYDGHGDCTFATFPSGRKRRSRHTCPYWRPISPTLPARLTKGEVA